MKQTKSIGIQLVFFALLTGAAGALWFGQDYVSEVLAAISGREDVAPEHRSSTSTGVPVVVARAGSRANDLTIESIATARARRFVSLYPEAAGEIVEFGVGAGDRVEEDEVILRLDSRDAELAVDLAEVQVDEAELQLARAQQLHDRNVNSGAQVQDARTVLKRAEIELEQAREALSDRTMRAPFDGVLGIPKVEVGDRVSSTSEIITVDDRSELIVEIEVPEAHLSHIEPGQPVAARTPGFPERSFDGVVEKIDSRVDPTSRMVMVRAVIPNPDDLLRPGMSFAVEVLVPGEEYATVPELALQWEKGESYVWRVRDGAAEKLTVRSVKRLNQVVLVDGDLRESDLVVVEGVQRLRPGREVSYSAPDSVAASAPGA